MRKSVCDTDEARTRHGVENFELQDPVHHERDVNTKHGRKADAVITQVPRAYEV